MKVLKRVFALLLAGVWVCGCCTAQLQSETDLTQDMVPRDSKTCIEKRAEMEKMLYTMYKGAIPRRMLKEVLPGLVEPLLPAVCVRSESYAKWLQKALAASGEPVPERPKRQVGFFGMPGMPMNVKDPGDRPPPGMARSPFKDPGDAPAGGMGLFGMTPMKDPGDAPAAGAAPAGEGAGGEGAAAMNPGFNPSAMMAMARRMISFSRPQVSFSQPFRGRLYGDSLPSLGRRKRSAEEDTAAADLPHQRQKRANGEEEKKGSSFDTFGFNLFADRPDHASASPVFPPFSFLQSFWNPPRQSQSPFQGNGQQRYSSPGKPFFGPRNQQRFFSNGANNVYQPFMPQQPFFGPRQQQAAGSPAAPGARGPIFSPLPPRAPGPVFPPVPPQPPTANGKIFGDNLPTFTSAAASRTRRVKRQSDNSDSNTNNDMVQFGDVTMPADTFTDMVQPQRRDLDYLDNRPIYQQSYLPPQTYLPPVQPMVQQPAFFPQQQLGFFQPRRAGFFPARQAGVFGRPMVPLPMGAAQPLVYGNAPVFG